MTNDQDQKQRQAQPGNGAAAPEREDEQRREARERQAREPEENGEAKSLNPVVDRPWARPAQEALDELDVSPEEGLSSAEVDSRRDEYGRNELKEAEQKGAWEILVDQVKNLIMALLVAAVILSFAFGNWIDGVAIIVVIVITIAIGFFTEWSGRRSMEKLREMGTAEALVRRGGREKTIDAAELVPGDIVILDEGDVVTADMRLVEAKRLQVDESALTGESTPVAKETQEIAGDTPLADRTNMVFRGTGVTRGDGTGVVVATGMDTAIGRISELAEEAEQAQTPLEKRLNRLGRRLVWVVIGLAAIIAVAGIIAGRSTFQIVETAVALAVAAVPEGLPIVATVALARGMWRMAKRNALVKQPSAVETLGSTTVIFSDKTGTLTENQMTVTRVHLPDEDIEVSGEGLSTQGEFKADGEPVDPNEHPLLREALEVGVLCNEASLTGGEDEEPAEQAEEAEPAEQEREPAAQANPSGDASEGDKEQREGEGGGEGEPEGEPLEVALLVAGAKAGIGRRDLVEEYPQERVVPFDPDVNMMATFHKQKSGYRVAVKGSPEAVVEAAIRVRDAEETRDLSQDEKQQWLEQNDAMADRGLRLIALATKEADSTDAEPYDNLTLLALFGLLDPPRGEVADSIAECQNAGIKVLMITGDHPGTARNVGRAVGLNHRQDEGDQNGEVRVMRGSEIESAAEEDVLDTRIFARVTPEQKLNLIDRYQQNDQIVAMTGDGVNDAPALQKADIGVAMGRRGTEVAKEAADMILQDDAFSSIVVAIEYGRIIFENIRKFTVYLISGNVGEIVAVAIATLTALPLPLLPLQILYINVLNDVFPSLALGMGGSQPGIMDKPPRDPQEPILRRGHWGAIVAYGVLIGLVVLATLWLALNWLGMEQRAAVTASFLVVAVGRLWHVFNMRAEDSGIIRNEVTRNPFVWGALALTIGLLLVAVYVPAIANILKVQPPSLQGWGLILGMSLIPLVVGQIAKEVGIFSGVSLTWAESDAQNRDKPS